MTPRKTSSQKLVWKRYAPVGLWLAGLSVFVGIVVLAIKVLVVIGIYAPAPETVKVIDGVGLGALAAFVIGLSLFALLDPKKVREFLTGRQARHGSAALINLIAVLGIVFVVNRIVYEYPVQMDWTEDKENTLAPETLSTLKALPEPVEAIGFFTANYPSENAEKILSRYKNSSDGKFTFRIVNPDREPALAARYQVARDGTIVLIMGERQESVTYASEQNITNALVRLLSPEERVVYFLTGHGEHSIEQGGDNSYRRVRTLL
ncbi:MAG: GldG family protein, partial [Anaerolineales bacterium]|nr:GldG family protein [Anaerolineales bacterium]